MRKTNKIVMTFVLIVTMLVGSAFYKTETIWAKITVNNASSNGRDSTGCTGNTCAGVLENDTSLMYGYRMTLLDSDEKATGDYANFWNDEVDIFSTNGNLDSNIKKQTYKKNKNGTWTYYGDNAVNKNFTDSDLPDINDTEEFANGLHNYIVDTNKFKKASKLEEKLGIILGDDNVDINDYYEYKFLIEPIVVFRYKFRYRLTDNGTNTGYYANYFLYVVGTPHEIAEAAKDMYNKQDEDSYNTCFKNFIRIPYGGNGEGYIYINDEDSMGNCHSGNKTDCFYNTNRERVLSSWNSRSYLPGGKCTIRNKWNELVNLFQFKLDNTTDKYNIKYNSLTGRSVIQVGDTKGPNTNYNSNIYSKAIVDISDVAKKKYFTINKKEVNEAGTVIGNLSSITFKISKNSGGVLQTLTTNSLGEITVNLTGNLACKESSCKYKVEEVVSTGWTPYGDSTQYITCSRGTENCGTLTFKNKKSEQQICFEELEKIIDDAENTGYQTDERIVSHPGLAKELLDLYDKYESKNYNNLLNFELTAESLKNITDSDGNKGCVTLKISNQNTAACDTTKANIDLSKKQAYSSSSIRTAADEPYKNAIGNEFYTFLNKDNPVQITIGTGEDVNKVTAHCKYYITGTSKIGADSVIKKYLSSQKSGTTLWPVSTLDKAVFETNLVVDCRSWIEASSLPTTTSSNGRQEFENKFTVDDSLKSQLENELKAKFGVDGSSVYKDLKLLAEIDGKTYEYNAVENILTYLTDDPLSIQQYYDNFGGETGQNYYYYNWLWNYKTKWGYSDDFINYFENGVGLKNDTYGDNFVGPTYGYATKPNYEGLIENKTYIKLTKDNGQLFSLASFFNSNSSTLGMDTSTSEFLSSKASCTATVEPEIIRDNKLNLAFRIIETRGSEVDAVRFFPGRDGSGRNTGTNWCSGTDCSANNSVVIDNIINRNNSYDRTNSGPIISITLDSNDITEIREYNASNEFDYSSYAGLRCTSGKNCQTQFVTNLLNNNYGTVSGLCVGNREGCIGRDS